MEIYLLRHGIAAQPGMISVAHDSERPLAPEGIQDMEKEALGLRRMGFAFDRIISSPYSRAHETAKIVSEALEFKGNIELNDSLIPEASSRNFVKILKSLTDDERILFVGYMPSLAEFVSRLLCGSDDAALNFKAGGFCCIDLPNPYKTHSRG